MKRFFICENCGNLIEVIEDSGVPMECCGESMIELLPGTTDAAHEKHIPEFVIEGKRVSVNVGAVEHPMVEEHFIEWIEIETSKGIQRKGLAPGGMPKVEFELTEDDSLIAVYAYCNLHGLWRADNK